MSSMQIAEPKPFLRWAGGKRQIVEVLKNSIPQAFFASNGTFFEPFIGGGALMFSLGDLSSVQYVPGNRVSINDLNSELICTYKVVRDDVEELVKKLKVLSTQFDESTYNKIRASRPRSDLSRATRFIYLNKTCFNGLWRVNNKGLFNVPWAGLRSPKILDENTLRAASYRLQESDITHGSYFEAVKKAKSGDLVYFDPPYIPASPTSNFSKYAKEDFGIQDQYFLAKVIKSLTDKGVKVILSNSDTSTTRHVFGDVLNLYQVPVQRMIAANSSSRQVVNEVIGVNFRLGKLTTLTPII